MIRSRRLLLVLAGLALFPVACGGGTTPTLSVASAPATDPPPTSVSTPVATSAASSTEPTGAATGTPVTAEPASPAPTVAATAAASDLLSLIPTEAGPYAVQAQAVPSELVSSYMPGIDAVLSAVGATPEDASLVLGGATGSGITDSAAIYALQVAGAETGTLAQAEVDRWLSQMVEGSTATQVTIGGKDVIQVGEQDPSFPKYAKYVYAVGDVVFVIDQAGNDAVIEEVLQALP